jgi:peptide-methionine (R)-S-oxide reductase
MLKKKIIILVLILLLPLIVLIVVRLGIPRGNESGLNRVGFPKQGKLGKTDEEWRQLLTPEQFRITRLRGTERAFSGAYWNTKDDGVYQCICCEQPLFDSKTKYDSATGWPSFWEPAEPDNVTLVPDNRFWRRGTEVLCSRCDAHLGHVFQDGPAPTGLRYCINSVSLKLVAREPAADQPTVEAAKASP